MKSDEKLDITNNLYKKIVQKKIGNNLQIKVGYNNIIDSKCNSKEIPIKYRVQNSFPCMVLRNYRNLYFLVAM